MITHCDFCGDGWAPRIGLKEPILLSALRHIAPKLKDVFEAAYQYHDHPSPQHTGYWLDFGFEDFKWAIELDGHPIHKERDEELTARGWAISHYHNHRDMDTWGGAIRVARTVVGQLEGFRQLKVSDSRSRCKRSLRQVIAVVPPILARDARLASICSDVLYLAAVGADCLDFVDTFSGSIKHALSDNECLELYFGTSPERKLEFARRWQRKVDAEYR